MDEELDAIVNGGRVLVGVAARSLAAHADDVTLPQLRALVLVRGKGPMRLSELASELDIDTSTATRMVDRLVRKGLLTRKVEESDRRALRLTLSPMGRGLLRRMTEYRRREIRKILQSMDEGDREHLHIAMLALSQITHEAPEVSDLAGSWDV